MKINPKQHSTLPAMVATEWIWSWGIRKGILACVLILGIISLINAQSSGSRGGVHSSSGMQPQMGVSDMHPQQRVEDYITVASKVELRLKPDQIRIVLAIGANAKTSAECEKKVFSKIGELKSALLDLGVQSKDIVDDFIAVLPRYNHVIEDQEGEKVAVETLLDYSMQSNLHIKVPNDELALRSIRAAFRLEITDIIAFDYWSSELEKTRQMAFDQAIAHARHKSQTLLGQTFDKMPQPINVQSSTEIIFPDSLYESVSNAHSQKLTQPYRGNLPAISAIRPKNTYYKGYIDRNADQQPETVPMHCEISVVSSVRLYFASPVNERILTSQNAARQRDPGKKSKAKKRKNLANELLTGGHGAS